MDAFWATFHNPQLWLGVVVTLELFAIVGILGPLAGLITAVLRDAGIPVISQLMWTYVWIMRGTPILLQLLFIYDVLPQFGVLLSSFSAAVVGLLVHEGATMGEIFRGGIHSVEQDQLLAGRALGMRRLSVFRIIVLPQALRSIVPPMGTAYISLVKNTSLASVIGLSDMLGRSESMAAKDYYYLQVYAAVGVVYLALSAIISFIQGAVERRQDFYRGRAESKGRLRNILWALIGARHRRVTRPSSQRGPPHGQGRASHTGTQAISDPSEADDFATEEGARAPGRPSLVDVLGIEAAARRTSGDVVVACRNATKRYGDRTILERLSFEVRSHEVVALMGGSGAGKSTLLRLISHLETLDSGEILVNGRHVGYRYAKNGQLKAVRNVARARAEANIGFVFQQFYLVRHLSAVDNVTLGPIYVEGRSAEHARADALDLLQGVGLEEWAEALPHELSGGQQQRVAIARAMARRPSLLLLDEPTSALDPELVGEVQGVLRDLAQAGMTMLLATHDVSFARDVADRVLIMEEGRIIEQGEAHAVLDSPQDRRTQRFLRKVAMPGAR